MIAACIMCNNWIEIVINSVFIFQFKFPFADNKCVPFTWELLDVYDVVCTYLLQVYDIYYNNYLSQ